MIPYIYGQFIVYQGVNERCWKNWIHMQRMKLISYFILYKKINSHG